MRTDIRQGRNSVLIFMHYALCIMHYFLIALFCTPDAYADSIPMRTCRPTLENVKIKNERLSSPYKVQGSRSFLLNEAKGSCYIGERHQLVVLVSFNDLSFQNDDPLPLWNRIFNERGFNEPPFRGSVSDYFLDQSYGHFHLTFDLYHVALEESRAKYRSTISQDENSQYLVQDIVGVLRTKNIDWSQYDWNDDGYVNQLLIIFPGLGMHNGGDSNSIWPHQWWLSQHTDSTGLHPEPLIVGSGDATYQVDCYCCANELMTRETDSSFGIICHEYSHCFGLPDFYNNSTTYVKEWDVMDFGNYNGNGYCPPNYSAHERMLMGWLTPTELATPTVVHDMPSTDTLPEAYIIFNNANKSEYYIVENRQQTGWDTHLPASGILVFHVVFDEMEWAIGHPNSVTNKRYTIFPANNIALTTATAGWAYPYEQNDSLTNYSSPASTLYYENTDGTNLMSKPLRNLRIENGLASFSFMDADSSSYIEELSTLKSPSGDLEGFLYDLTGRQIVNGKSVNSKLSRGIYISNGKKIFVR